MNAWIVLTAIVLVAPILAGCFGEDDAPEVDDGLGEGVVVKDDGGGPKTPGTNVSKKTDHSGAKNEPSAHFHHYWGDPPLASVPVYDGKVPFKNWDNKYALAYNTLSWAEFGLEDDANDVDMDDPANDDPIGSAGVADTVFAGANRLTVHFPDSFPEGVNSMLFFYKPANTPIFFPDNGLSVTPGDVVEIELNEVGMTDPPHQYATSRWKFRLMAQNALCDEVNLEGSQCPPAVIQEAPQDPQEGSTYEWGSRNDGLEIIAHNGGVKSLDPPHPDFWKGAEVLDLSTVSGTVGDTTVQTPVVRERIQSMTDIAMLPNNIVPLGTDYVQVRVSAENGAPGGEDVYLKLYYHAADTVEYQEAQLDSVDGDTRVYKIVDEKGTLVDPPYESNSFWRFKLVPTMDVGGNEQEHMGTFEGTWTMEFTAHKKPGFILT